MLMTILEKKSKKSKLKRYNTIKMTQINFNKELLLSCQNNIELFLLHLPNPSDLIQEILYKDDLDLYKQIQIEIYLLKHILHISLKFNKNRYIELIERSSLNISKYLNEKLEWSVIIPPNSKILFLIDIREINQQYLYIEYAKWIIELAKIIQINISISYGNLIEDISHNHLFVNELSIKKLLAPYILSDEYKLGLHPYPCSYCRKIEEKYGSRYSNDKSYFSRLTLED